MLRLARDPFGFLVYVDDVLWGRVRRSASTAWQVSQICATGRHTRPVYTSVRLDTSQIPAKVRELIDAGRLVHPVEAVRLERERARALARKLIRRHKGKALVDAIADAMLLQKRR